ncbi:MAG TPA: ATP-binding protein [Gemmatimonadaceae bacterium]|nr:ATP-binding protein [Gemmatimonadaceae bacterium]
MRGRLNRRLLAWFLLFSLVPLIATNVIGYRRSHGIIERQVERALASIAQVEAQHIRDRVDRHLLLMEAIVAGNEFLKAGALRARGLPAGEMGGVATPQAVAALLDEKRRELPAFAALYLYTPDGHVIAASGGASDIAPILPTERGGPSISIGMSGGATDPEPEFRLVAPLIRPHVGLVAFLGGTVRLSGFSDFLQMPDHVAGPLVASVVDEHRRPLFVSGASGPVDFTAPLRSPLLVQPRSDPRYRDAAGVEQLGAVADIPGYPWRFLVEAPAAEAFGELRALGGLSAVLEFLLGCAIVAMAWIVAAEIVAPIGRLLGATRRVAGGDLTARVTAPERDEIGELGRAFNDMTAALATTTARVAELHQREIERASQLATVGELASGIAHEIKNPVVGVSNGLDLVRRRIGPDPALSPITDEMARQLARIQQAMQELLTFARPAEPTLAPVSAAHLVDRAIRLVQPTADRAGVRLEVRAESAPRLLGDEDMLHQAIVNVVMNAVQATASGGAVRITVSGAEHEIHIAVEDTGRGIAAADLDAVFKPFFTTRHTGTGLGLPITREIVQRHGGSVTLASTPGVGTSVVLRLPRARAAATRPEEALAS